MVLANSGAVAGFAAIDTSFVPSGGGGPIGRERGKAGGGIGGGFGIAMLWLNKVR